jgi:hypothetical protein
MTRLPSSAVLLLCILTSACTVMTREPPAVVASPPPPIQLEFATFKGTEQTIEGGVITRVVYAERGGDAVLSSMSVVDGDLFISGMFAATGRGAFAGIGMIANAPSGPFNASSYRFLRLRLSAAPGVNMLRVRLVGPDAGAQLSGCYPVVYQAVTPQVKVYDIALTRFAAEGYCGTRGISAAQTLPQLDAIEVVDAVAPVRPRAVQFSVGSIALLG